MAKADTSPQRHKLTIEERRDFGRKHLEWGRKLIVRQREMVERHKAEGRDPTAAQRLLAVLEQTQLAFERDLARLLR